MKHATKFYYFVSLLIFFLFAAQLSYADGSKDLYPAGISGNRAFLLSKKSAFGTNSDYSWPFLTLGTHYVYAKVGETISMASSVSASGTSRIRLIAPNGTEFNSPTTGNMGRIYANGSYNTRSAELAGPRVGYTPYEVPVDQTGIWRVEFIPSGGENSTSVTQVDIKADAQWTQAASSALIAAWDVSVRNAADDGWISGRVYANVFNFLINGSSINQSASAYYGVNYVLTKDGYVYKVDNNGSNGVGFTSFVNNQGFVDGSKNPIYKSIDYSDGRLITNNDVQDPRAADVGTGITHKMFYTLPANDLPASSSGAVPGGETWLKNTRLAPKVTNLVIKGVDGTVGQVSNKGGNVFFDANLAGRYILTISSPKSAGDPEYFVPRVITGSGIAGTNNVIWDGKDGSPGGGVPLPNGDVPAKISVQLQGAEVHFPYIDMEINPNGLKLELLNETNTATESDIVYWDDSAITGGLAAQKSNPITNLTGLHSVQTPSNGHKWGTYAVSSGSGNSGTGSSSFGNEKSMDTWSFVLGAVEVIEIDIKVKQADLKVESITPDKTEVKVGENIVYTVVVKNDGPSDVEQAPFSFNVPSGYEISTVQPIIDPTCSTESAGAISTDKLHYNSKLDLKNQCVVTYKVTVVPVLPSEDPLLVEATILRPNDVTDPDATNNLTPAVPPTDPHFECEHNGLGVACNNIKSDNTVKVLNPKISLVKSVSNVGTGSGVGGAFLVGDIINYRFLVKNTGNIPLSSISLTESLAGVTLSSTKTGDPENDNILNPGEEWTYTGSYSVILSDQVLGKVVNQATATGTDSKGEIISDLSGTAANNDTPTETPIQQTGEIKVLKTGTYLDSNNDGKVNVGDKINYTFKVENSGNVTLTNISISDPNVTVTGGPIALAPAAVDNTTFTAVYTLTQADIDKGGVYNLATATGTDPSGTPVSADSESDNAAGGTPGVPPVDPTCLTCTITPLPSSPAMRLTKTGTSADSNNDGKVNVGDKINYTFKVENTGNVSLTNISISDPKVTVTGGPINLAPNAVDNTSFTAVYTLTQTDVDKGGVYNLATATGTDPSGNSVSDDSESGNAAGGTPGVPPVDPTCLTCTITPLPSSPAMRLTKTGTSADSNNDGKVNVGDKINYTFKVENIGNVSLTNISISDPKVTVIGGPINLAPNAVDNTSFTAVYTLTQADVDKGGVYNLATATGTDPSGNSVSDDSESGNAAGGTPGVPPVDPTCLTCTITPLPSSPAMRLTKTGTYADSNNDGKVNVGDKINYTFKVENTGNVSLTDISISDPKVTVIGGPINLAPNAVDNTSFTAVYTLTQVDIDKGGVYNLATATGTDPSGNSVSDDSESGNAAGGTPGVPPVDPTCLTCTITPLPSSPAMRLTKTGTYADSNNDGKVNVGDKINYTFKVENTGNVSLTDISISDPKVTVIGGPINLAPNAVDNTSFTAVYTLTQADVDKGGVYNLATATGTDPSGNSVSDDSESGNAAGGTPGVPPVDPTCLTCTITPLPSSPAMRLTKTGTYADSNNDGKVNVGDKINYTFKVENTGNVSLTNISISDPKVTVTGGPINLAPNAVDNTSFTAVYTLTQTDVDKGGVYNLATATGTDPSGNSVSDDSESGNAAGGTPGVPPVDPTCPTCTITPLPSSPAMRLTKTGTYADSNNDGKVNVGDKINYTFKVENTGNVSLTNISISDPKVTVTGGPINLAPNAVDNTSFTAVYTLTQADVDKGGVYNLATATGTDPSGTPVSADSESGNAAGGTPGVPSIDPTCPTCTITPLPSSPGLSLTKNTSTGAYNKIGDVITYTLKVKNTGNVTLNSVIITDTNADAGSISPNTIATLNVGAEITVTAKHTLVQADLDKGFVYNIANAAAKDPKDGNVTATSVDNNPAYPAAPVDPTCPTCTITEVQQNGSVALIKKVTNTGTGENGAFVLGNQIEYTFTITNTGNVSLKDLVLSDPLLSTPSISIPGVLLPGTSVTRVERYTITAGDIARGNVTNQALVSATDPKNKIVTDKSGTSNADDVATVTAVAKPPVAKDDTNETKQNKPVVIDVQKNDEPGNSAIVPGSTTIITQPKNGTVKVNTDGTVTYTPNQGYTGPDEFTYTVTDKNGQISNPAKVGVTVVPTKPVAIDDTAETQWNTAVNIPVLGNDKTDGAAFDKGTVEITEQPKHGTIKVNSDGTVTYLPNSGYTGTDTFKYRVKDEYGNWTDVANVTVTTKGFFIPNVITPNGDGKNDKFVIVGLENFSNVELTIFNRWGNEVYRNKNYQNTWTGEGLNEGTYYYLIRLNNSGKQEVYKGWVLIKR